MSQIGYYNYYNNPHRYSPTEVVDRYQEMVDRATGDEIYANNEDPYSDKNKALRNLDEELASTAASIRSRCRTQQEVHVYLSQKYFGTSDFAYTKKWTDPERYAMFENEYNAVCYGTIGGGNFNDPRLSEKVQFKTYEEQKMDEKAANQRIISNQISSFLQNHGIRIEENQSFHLSINPYSYFVQSSGDMSEVLLQKIKELLESNNDSRDIFYWGLNNGAKYSEESLTKWRAYQNVKRYSGLELPQLQLIDGKFYTEDGKDVWELVKEGIRKDSSIATEFKGAANDYVRGLMDVIADKGWDNIPDIQMDIMYSGKNGLYVA